MPCSGLSSLECLDNQKSIPPPPHLGVSQSTSRCEVFHEAQCMMGLQQHVYEGRGQMEGSVSYESWPL
jgi:hypothetical protein